MQTVYPLSVVFVEWLSCITMGYPLMMEEKDVVELQRYQGLQCGFTRAILSVLVTLSTFITLVTFVTIVTLVITLFTLVTLVGSRLRVMLVWVQGFIRNTFQLFRIQLLIQSLNRGMSVRHVSLKRR